MRPPTVRLMFEYTAFGINFEISLPSLSTIRTHELQQMDNSNSGAGFRSSHPPHSCMLFVQTDINVSLWDYRSL